MTRQECLILSVAEECNEIAVRVSKLMRFGAHEVQPGQSLTNAQRLTDEMNDLQGAISKIIDEGIIPRDWKDFEKIEAKRKKIEKFVQYSIACGTVDIEEGDWVQSIKDVKPIPLSGTLSLLRFKCPRCEYVFQVPGFTKKQMIRRCHCARPITFVFDRLDTLSDRSKTDFKEVR